LTVNTGSNITKSSATKKLFKNTYVKLIRNVVLMVQGLVLTPLVLAAFGVDLAGIWFLITQFSAYVQLAEFGIPSGLARLYSRSVALDDQKSANENAVVSFLILGAASILLLTLHEQLVDLFFYIFKTIERNQNIESVVSFGIIAIAMSLPFRCGLGILEANHLFYVHLWVEISFVLLRLIILFILYFYDFFEIQSLTKVYFSIAFCIPFIQFLLSIKHSGVVLNFRLQSSYLRIGKQLLSVSAALALIMASVTMLRQGSPMILGIIDSTESVALFTISMLAIIIIMQFLTVAVSFIGPQASQLSALGQSRILYELFLNYSRYSLVVAINIYILFLFYGESLLSIWLGAEHLNLPLIYESVVIILAALVVSVPGLYARSVLSYVDKYKVTSISELIVVLTGLTIGAIMVLIFDSGVIGMAYGIAIVFFLRAFGPVLFIFTKQYRISKLSYLIDVYWSNTLQILIVSPMLLIGFIYFDNEFNDITYFLYALLSCFGLILLQWYFVVDKKHRHIVRKKWSNILN